jgi:hypothetical protein
MHMQKYRLAYLNKHNIGTSSELMLKTAKNIPQERDSHYDSEQCHILVLPFINNFVSSPFNKITEFGPSRKDHST